MVPELRGMDNELGAAERFLGAGTAAVRLWRFVGRVEKNDWNRFRTDCLFVLSFWGVGG